MKNNNITINGLGTVPSGSFNEIKISGNGSGKGTLEAKYIKVNGLFTFDGKIECESIEISGSLECTRLETKNVEVYGHIKSEEVLSENVKIRSSRDCRIDTIKCDLLITESAKEIPFFSRVISTISAKIAITKKIPFFRVVPSIILANKVICKQIEVENLVAKQVECETLKAGRHTKIDKLICTEYTTDAGATIKEVFIMTGRGSNS